MQTKSGSVRMREARTVTAPSWGVNLMALSIRLMRIFENAVRVTEDEGNCGVGSDIED